MYNPQIIVASSRFHISRDFCVKMNEAAGWEAFIPRNFSRIDSFLGYVPSPEIWVLQGPILSNAERDVLRQVERMYPHHVSQIKKRS